MHVIGASSLPRTPIAIAIACVLVHAVGACDSSDAPHVVLHGTDGPVRVEVELARTREEQARGLMWREEMPERHGMLFVFPDSRQRSFWMKNTPLPLDIVYISDDARIVSIAADTTPYSTQSIPSGAPARYVLEVHAGLCARHGIDVGARVELPAAVGDPAPAAGGS